MVKNKLTTCQRCKNLSFNYPEAICKIIREIKSLDCKDGSFFIRPIGVNAGHREINNYMKLTKALEINIDKRIKAADHKP